MSYNIIDVAKDFIKGDLEYASKEDAAHRLSICKSCDANIAGMCSCCGCVIKAKVKMAKSECPMELWHSVSKD